MLAIPSVINLIELVKIFLPAAIPTRKELWAKSRRRQCCPTHHRSVQCSDKNFAMRIQLLRRAIDWYLVNDSKFEPHCLTTVQCCLRYVTDKWLAYITNVVRCIERGAASSSFHICSPVAVSVIVGHTLLQQNARAEPLSRCLKNDLKQLS